MSYTYITLQRAITPHNTERATKVRNYLMQAVEYIDANRNSYVDDPRAFMRRRKISFSDLLIFVMLINRGDMTQNIRELTEGDNSFSEQALYKRMNLVSPRAFMDLFHKFNALIRCLLKFDQKWHYYAIDGTENRFYVDDGDPDFDRKIKTRGKPNGSMRLVVLFDVDNHMMVDGKISDSVKTSEPRYAIKLIEENDLPDNAILTGDRYYAGFQTLASFIENLINFIVRIKDQTSKTAWAKNLGLPDGEFDLSVTLRLSFSQKRWIKESAKEDGCYYVHLQNEFKYLDEDDVYYDMPIRLIRFSNPSVREGEEGEWVTLATSMPKELYSTEEAIEGYTKRWAIETAFLELKQFCGMEYFHSRKKQLIEQEIWAKMTFFNVCSLYKNMVGVFKKKKLSHMLNLRQAIFPITRFLLFQYDLEKFLIELYKKTSPIRKNRHNPRKSGKRKGPIPFIG